MIDEKTKIAIPVGGVYAAIVGGMIMFLGSYFALYARVGQIETNDKINCLILLNVQNHTVPVDKRIERKCE